MSFQRNCPWIFSALLTLGLSTAGMASSSDTIQWSGFLLARGGSIPDSPALEQDSASAQIQLGIDWLPSPLFGGHIHLLGRTDDGGAEHGKAGVVEAYLEANAVPYGDRIRIRAGAMFLPASFENVDALWENPYTITPSALTTWFGEEFRPIGIDMTWFHEGFKGGATVFRGNDTFGALPPVRGWALRDHWILLGEKIPVDDEYVTSVSDETDGRLGWSARGGWSGKNLSFQFTHIDNRSDALEHGDLLNWNTQFDLLGGDFSTENWTIAGESGWGPTAVIVHGATFVSDIRAHYLLVSRRFRNTRVTIRADAFDNGKSNGQAFTAAWIRTSRARIQTALEMTASEGDSRVLFELRYHFAKR